MKKLLCLIAFSVIPSIAFAGISTISFQPYSSATPMSCAILTATAIEGDSMTPQAISVLSLGTKSVGTYTIGENDKYLKASCYATATGPSNAYTATFTNATSGGLIVSGTKTFGSNLGTFVKMYFNGASSSVFPVTNVFFKTK